MQQSYGITNLLYTQENKTVPLSLCLSRPRRGWELVCRTIDPDDSGSEEKLPDILPVRGGRFDYDSEHDRTHFCLTCDSTHGSARVECLPVDTEVTPFL